MPEKMCVIQLTLHFYTIGAYQTVLLCSRNRETLEKILQMTQ
jgi:hypothetical protein